MQNKPQSMVGRRLLGATLDALICLLVSYVAFAAIFNPVVNRFSNYEETSTSYRAHYEEYRNIQVEYGIYSYVGSSLSYNQGVSDDTRERFLNDERIIALNEAMEGEQTTLLWLLGGKAALSLGTASIILYIVLPLCLGKGRTLGKLIFKLSVIDEGRNYPKWYFVLLRYLMYILINVFGGVITFLILPLANLLVAVLNKKNRAIYDLILKLDVIDGSLPISVLYPPEE